MCFERSGKLCNKKAKLQKVKDKRNKKKQTIPDDLNLKKIYILTKSIISNYVLLFIYNNLILVIKGTVYLKLYIKKTFLTILLSKLNISFVCSTIKPRNAHQLTVQVCLNFSKVISICVKQYEIF